MNIVFKKTNYSYPYYRINATWASGIIAPSGILSPKFATPFINVHSSLKPIGFNNARFDKPVATKDDEYINAYANLSASWAGKTTYKHASHRLIVSFGHSNAVYATGIDSLGFGDNQTRHITRLTADGFDSQKIGRLIVADSTAYIGSYQSLEATWYLAQKYTPNRFSLAVSFSNKTQIFAVGVDNAQIDTPVLLSTQKIQPQGIDSTNFGNSFVLHPWQYVKQYWQLNATWLGSTTYKDTPATAFYVGWFIPTGSLNIGAIGFVGSQIDSPTLSNYQKAVNPTGFEVFHYFGQPVVINKTQTIKTGNIDMMKVGNGARISFAIQPIAPNGLDATIWLADQKDKERKNYHPTFVADGVRRIETHSISHDEFGEKTWLSYHTRLLAPDGIVKSQQDLASNHAVIPTQYVLPEGLDATQWLTRIIPNNDVIYPKGIVGELGIPSIDNYSQYIAPKGFGNNDGSADTVRFGKLQIFNQTQYISQYFIPDSGLVPQVFDQKDDNGKSDFGKWIAIGNRNRAIGAFGVDNSAFGYQQIDNKAVPVLPTPIAGEFGRAMIAYRVRHLALDGIEAPYFSYWHIIRNTAKPIQIKGIHDTAFGTPSLASNLQAIKQIFPFDNSDIGTPMIADKVHHIDIEWRYSINPPSIPLPTIDNHTRYITPQGFDGTDGFKRKFGRSELNERFNIIKSHGYDHSLFGGEVFIKNTTPELKFFGHNSNEFGEPTVRNEWRQVEAFGNQMNAMGVPIIKDRKQTIKTAGFNADEFGWHKAIRQSSPPYSVQYIELRRFDAKGRQIDGFGIEIDRTQVPTPSVRTNVLRPKGFDAKHFGQTTIWANSIIIDSGIFELSVGKPKVWIKQQFIRPQGIDEYISHTKIGKPQLSPYTIYAPSSDMATAQAQTNHPSTPYNPPMDMAVFGKTDISNQHRTIYPHHKYQTNLGDMQMFGQVGIDNKDQVINPKSFKGGYFGWHIIPFVPQTLTQFEQKEHQTHFGNHNIGFIGEQQNHIKAGDLASIKFGKTVINHFHRTIYPHSFVATQMGQSLYYDTPFMWQGLRVGERVLGNYGGFDSSAFGQAWMSNKIREVLLNGFDSFVSETDIRHFKGRLVVKRVGKAVAQSKKTQSIKAVGIESNNLPAPNIKNKVQYIRPDGNSDQFRKGAW